MPLQNPFRAYLRELRANLAAGNATEHTHRPALKTLLEAAVAGGHCHERAAAHCLRRAGLRGFTDRQTGRGRPAARRVRRGQGLRRRPGRDRARQQPQ